MEHFREDWVSDRDTRGGFMMFVGGKWTEDAVPAASSGTSCCFLSIWPLYSFQLPQRFESIKQRGRKGWLTTY